MQKTLLNKKSKVQSDMYNIEPFILKRKIPDISEILMHRAFLKGNLRSWGEELGVWGTEREGDFKKIIYSLVPFKF